MIPHKWTVAFVCLLIPKGENDADEKLEIEFDLLYQSFCTNPYPHDRYKRTLHLL